METNLKPLPTINDFETIRSGYQAAINLWIYEGTQIWSKFTAMVYANTIFIATIGILITYTGQRPLGFLRIGLCLLGLTLCISWLFLTKRSFAFYKYWIFSSRELEEKLSPLQTVSRGATLADGESVSFQFKTSDKVQTKTLQIKVPRVEKVTYFIIIVFIAIYILAAYQFVCL